MIESYQTEVARKRKAARIFWFLVFVFATFLYFFFQGYYPDVRVGFKKILSESGATSSGNTDLIKSFGIINISVKSPIDATITLGSGSFTNNEKRMSNYGIYTANISRDNYISDIVDFVIEKETPYYIANINLLRSPTYSRIHTGSEVITRIQDALYLRNIDNKKILQDDTFSGGMIHTQTGLIHIGGGYAISGTTLLLYDGELQGWEELYWSGSTSFVSKCSSALRIEQGFLSCDGNKSVLTEKGKILTGVIDINSRYLKFDTTIMPLATATSISLTGNELTSPRYIEENGNWYSQSGTTFVPLFANKKKGLQPIVTGLDSIGYANWVGDELVMLGDIGKQKYLVIIESSTHRKKMIEFPNVELIDIRIEKYDGNFFIKTRNALLFLYNDSKKIEWLIDGQVLAFSQYGAIYIKDGATWQAIWSEE